MQYLDARELEYRLRSKEDFYVYLDEHRKCLVQGCLAVLDFRLPILHVCLVCV